MRPSGPATAILGDMKGSAIYRSTVILSLLVGAGHCAAAPPDYLKAVKPVLKAKCFSCHGALKQEGGLRLDTVELMKSGGDSGPAIEPGDDEASLLLYRITAPADERMPPEAEPVPPEQIEQIREWLKHGAAAPPDEHPQVNPAKHWSFQPIRSASPAAAGHPIDHFIDRKLAEAGLQRAAPADAHQLVRRLFLDLHGLLPTPEQTDHWTAQINRDRNAAVRALTEKLLNSPRYGERWAQHWLDIVRYADTHGFEVNTPRPNAWPYRDFVIDAFNRDMPYDQFVTAQLAGDLTGHEAGTGFLVAAAALLPGQIGKDEASMRLARQDELDEIIVGTTASILGLTVGCARCHDHKFDPISQHDYYALQAFFAGVDYGEREVRGPDFHQRQKRADQLQAEIDRLKQQLSDLTPVASAGETIVIDDEDTARVSLLKKKNGHGTNPEGTARGFLNDTGSPQRFGNLSGGRYTWFDNTPGEDVFTWNPKITGTYRIWISWGVHGSGVHTRDARYVLDHDGDLATQQDQQQIAVADQYYFAGQSNGISEKRPLWSGLLDAGIHDLQPSSRLVLRGGETGTGITADVVVLQQVLPEPESNDTPLPLPKLRVPVNARHNVERFAPVTARFVRFTTLNTNEIDRYQPCLDELEVFAVGSPATNIALAGTGTTATSSGNYSDDGKHQLKHINDGRYGNSFSWISNQIGRGWVQLEFPAPQPINRIEWGRDREGRFTDRLPIRYVIETSMDGKHWTTVARSEDRLAPGTPFDPISLLALRGAHAEGIDLSAAANRLEELETQQAKLRKPRVIFAGKFRQPDPTFVLNRGDPEQPTEPIAPRVPTALGTVQLPSETSDAERRRRLAEWLTAPDHPLTARVMANRIWQYHFGRGLVDTPSDFGLNGAAPTHPMLLDWLATELIRSGWSIKHLHRLILTSQTYQQHAVNRQPTNRDGLYRKQDADNRLLWHFPTRRMEAEAIRDCILQVSGELNLQMGGPGFDFFKSRGGLSGFPPLENFTAGHKRRMIYAHKIRMERVPVFGAFDCPDAGLPKPKRSQSTTAIQALNLFNSPFVMDQAAVFARRIQSSLKANDRSKDSAAAVQVAFRMAFGRLPTRVELQTTLPVVEQHGLPTLCRVIFNTNEFLFIP